MIWWLSGYGILRRDAAAIGSERAAELYGLQVLERDIQGDTPNICRFLVLSRDPLVTGEPPATSHRPSLPSPGGHLQTYQPWDKCCRAEVFCLRMPWSPHGISLTKI